MATDAGWREGARAFCPDDVCPGCGTPGVHFASDFSKFGKHSVRACTACNAVFHNGKREGDLTVFPHDSAPAPTTRTAG